MNPHAVQPPIAIRLASPGDAEGIRQVYAPFAHTPVTFEEVEPDPAEFRGRMEEILALLADPDFYLNEDASTDVIAEHAILKKRIAEAEEEWFTLNEELEAELERQSAL